MTHCYYLLLLISAFSTVCAMENYSVQNYQTAAEVINQINKELETIDTFLDNKVYNLDTNRDINFFGTILQDYKALAQDWILDEINKHMLNNIAFIRFGREIIKCNNLNKTQKNLFLQEKIEKFNTLFSDNDFKVAKINLNNICMYLKYLNEQTRIEEINMLENNYMYFCNIIQYKSYLSDIIQQFNDITNSLVMASSHNVRATDVLDKLCSLLDEYYCLDPRSVIGIDKNVDELDIDQKELYERIIDIFDKYTYFSFDTDDYSTSENSSDDYNIDKYI